MKGGAVENDRVTGFGTNHFGIGSVALAIVAQVAWQVVGTGHNPQRTIEWRLVGRVYANIAPVETRVSPVPPTLAVWIPVTVQGLPLWAVLAVSRPD